MDDLFIELQLIEDDIKAATIRRKPLDSFEDILELNDDTGHQVKRILVRAKAGAGKSTMISKIAYEWAKDDDTHPYSQYELVFTIDLNEVKPGSNLNRCHTGSAATQNISRKAHSLYK